MNNHPAQALREMIAPLLPPRAFLKRDRQDALFVTNAPRIAPCENLTESFEQAGFIASNENDLIRLWPGIRHIIDFENARPSPPDFLCESLIRFRGMDADEESIRLFALGLRILDGDDNPGYEKMLRQRAAVCLRNGSGGGLYACGILAYMIKRSVSDED